MSSVSNPLCGICGATKILQKGLLRCRPCLTRAQAARKKRLTPEQAEAERVHSNALRNARRAGWTDEQRAAANARTQAWREAHREEHRSGTRDWYARNAEDRRSKKLAEYYAAPEKFYARNLVRKARLLDAICEHGPKCVDDAFLAALYSRPCVYCGDVAEAADHIFPLAHGGLHCQDNLVPACSPCNLRKAARDPFDWLLMIQELP